MNEQEENDVESWYTYPTTIMKARQANEEAKQLAMELLDLCFKSIDPAVRAAHARFMGAQDKYKTFIKRRVEDHEKIRDSGIAK